MSPKRFTTRHRPLNKARNDIFETKRKLQTQKNHNISVEKILWFNLLVAVFVLKRIRGKGIVDNATDSIKAYADSVLYELKSGAVQPRYITGSIFIRGIKRFRSLDPDRRKVVR